MELSTSVKDSVHALDTNIILRLILNDIPEQRARAIKLLTSGAKFYVDDYIFGECEHVLERIGFSRQGITERLNLLLANDIFIWNQALFTKVFNLYLTHPKLSFNDCYLAAKTKSLNFAPLWTFDQKIATQLSGKIPT